ncbi:MAG TPA: UDP-3-O-acyl-N-acetylglucosamine deacetylase [Rhizomicrobium sp.]|jgi:UDP-3-O-[3-hydroxymyristoyl] N-acetylglucosamine deacetylase|nr:UDP-3-O-acyl-N-acetylglucosamine deacetylase [Rhizomicrobium sp.]
MTRRSILREVSCDGVALHAGSSVRARLLPAPAGAGVVFRRNDLGGREIPALYDRVGETRLGTVIAENGATVAVIEHLMAAVAGAGVDDLIVALDGPEPPILDGDALSWLLLLEQAGFRDQPGTRGAIRIARQVEVAQGGASAALVPAEALDFDFDISFPSAAIGTQRLLWAFSGEAFRRDIAPARTFGFVNELDALRGAGLARGASLENTLAIDGDTMVNPDLQRFPDEFVRHKILDAIGDLALAGVHIIGRFVGRRSGHALNNALLRALFSDPVNYELIET